MSADKIGVAIAVTFWALCLVMVWLLIGAPR